MSVAMSFLQRVVAAVGPASGAGPALRPAGPVALGRFLRRRWLPSLRHAMTLARASEDEEMEEQPSAEPTPSAPSVQTVRRAPALRRTESETAAADAAPQAASDPGPSAEVARLARAEGVLAAAARNTPRDAPAFPAARAAAPRVAAGSAPSVGSSVHHAEGASLVFAPAGSASVDMSAPAGEPIGLRLDDVPAPAIAPLSGAGPLAAGSRAPVADAAASPAARLVHGEAPASYADPAPLTLPSAPGAIVDASGWSAATESAMLYAHAAGEPTRAMMPAENPRQPAIDAGPGRALPEARDEVRTAEPLVQIGSIEIIIEAAEPPPQAAVQTAAPASARDFASRFYLRGL